MLTRRGLAAQQQAYTSQAYVTFKHELLAVCAFAVRPTMSCPELKLHAARCSKAKSATVMVLEAKCAVHARTGTVAYVCASKAAELNEPVLCLRAETEVTVASLVCC